MIHHEGTKDTNVRAIERALIVEVKSVDRLLPIHRAQVLTYLKLTSRPVALHINFNVELLRNGVRRVLNG
jgi:GxxExxY protein